MSTFYITNSVHQDGDHAISSSKPDVHKFPVQVVLYGGPESQDFTGHYYCLESDVSSFPMFYYSNNQEEMYDFYTGVYSTNFQNKHVGYFHKVFHLQHGSIHEFTIGGQPNKSVSRLEEDGLAIYAWSEMSPTAVFSLWKSRHGIKHHRPGENCLF